MKIRRMTQDAFEKAVDNFVNGTGKRRRQFRGVTLEMAKLVLVDGRSLVEVAREYGKLQPNVFLAVEKIANAWQPSNDSLVEVELTLPGELAEQLKLFSECYAAKMADPETLEILQRILSDLKFATRKLQE